MTTCKFCSKEQVSRTAYEDGLYNIIVEWLCERTCLKWYRLPIDFRRPDQDDDEQYGMIDITDHRPNRGSYRQNLVDREDEEGNVTTCVQVEKNKGITIELSVFREAGEKINCDQEPEDKQWVRSAVDILEQVNDIVGFDEFTHTLTTSGITIKRTDSINPDVREISEIYERFAVARFTADVCYTTSYQLNGDEQTYCVELCDGTPLCVAEKTKCED